MLVLQRIVSLEEFSELCRDLTYTKVEVRPNDMNKFRDIKVNCYLKVNTGEICYLKAMIRLHCINSKLSLEDRSFLIGLDSLLKGNNMWIKVKHYKQLLEMENKYDIRFSIPKKYKIYA